MLKNLKLLRNKAGISQQKLADAIGVSQQSVNKYENHAVEPDIQTMILLADFFHVSVDLLIGHYISEHNNEQSYPCALNDDELRFLQKYRLLSEKEKYSIENIADLFIKK